MSTTGVSTWAVDLAEVGPIYPFQGLEWLFAILAVGAWLGWHVWCIRWEQDYHRTRIRKYGDEANLRRAVDRD
jgi:hypothetical protein